MRKLALLLSGILAIAATTSPARADVWDNSDFFAWREKLRAGMTDYQAMKFCDRLEGDRVHFTSYVYSVRKSGIISADMDGRALWSMPEVEIMLADDSQTEIVREHQDIEYYGNIASCSFNSTTDMLSLTISNGRLVRHY